MLEKTKVTLLADYFRAACKKGLGFSHLQILISVLKHFNAKFNEIIHCL